MRHSQSILAAAFVGGLSIIALAQEKGGGDETGAYEVVANWPTPLAGHDGWVSGPITGVFAESPDRVFVLQRGELQLPQDFRGANRIFGATGRTASSAVSQARREHFVLVVDRSGTITETWDQWDSLWEGSPGPHKIKINPYDPEKHVWIIVDGLHQIFKFTNDGKKLVMTLGERLVPGNDETHFARPADIDWLPDGTFFVADGYINRRVVKFDKDGKFLMAWGKQGAGPGEFGGTVHAVAIDNQRRLYVADRGNGRIHVFDENGKVLDQWPNIREPWHLHVSTDQQLWVSGGETAKMLKYDRTGKLLYSFGTYGQFPGGMWGVHQFSVDQEGNLYLAEAYNGRVEKFRPAAGADRAKVIPPERPLKRTS